MESQKSNLKEKEVKSQDPVILESDREIARLEAKLKEARARIPELEEAVRVAEMAETARIERMVAEAEEAVEAQEEEQIVEEIVRLEPLIKDPIEKKSVATFLQNIRSAVGKALKRKIIKYAFLPLGITTAVALKQHSPQEYYEMAQNYKERHWDKLDEDDPNIVGINNLYNAPTVDVERTTYDFLGEQQINYKWGYYITSVFDLTDRTPPKFKIINGREYNQSMTEVAGITTNLFKPFQKPSEFKPVLKGHWDGAIEKNEIPVIGYNTKTGTMRAGHLKEFDDDWLVSETYEIPLNFKLNPDGTINLTYPKATLRMSPITTNEDGIEIPFQIGITRDKSKTTYNPYEATSFGVLEGGKVIMVCGEKQLQVNGSFADIYRVYERLKKEFPGVPIQAYLLDNGSYNLPIWDKDNTLTPEEIRQHLLRNKDGGTALVLENDESISPYEYKNKYPEFQHQIEGFTLDPQTGKPAVNERSVIVVHHTGNYKDPQEILRQFANPANERSAHVVIFKDGTRHIFNNDRYVLAHAGKSDFNDRNAVNFFSLGIEMEGDSTQGKQFTVAQIESMLEYMRPRIEKYGITLNNITTHKIIRDNYIKKHPEEQGVPTKTDLSDKVWEQLRDLIAKKLYNIEKPGVVSEEGSKLLGALGYQEAFRLTQDEKFASTRMTEMLDAFNAREQARTVEKWVSNFN